MFESLFSRSFLLDLPIWGLLFFMLLFVGVIVRVFWPRRRPIYQRMAQLPLADGEEVSS